MDTIKKNLRSLIPTNILQSHYLGILTGILLILKSEPFLKIPFDMWEHLIRIRSIYDTGDCWLFYQASKRSRCEWHRMWATIFRTLNIDDFFVWAKIIHVSQTLLAFFAIFFFSMVSLKLLVPKFSRNKRGWMALISVFLWFLGFGTNSGPYTMSWISWYSVNYQGLTIPLFWIMAGLLLLILYSEKIQTRTRIFYTFTIFVLSIIVAKLHSMELLYFLLFIPFLCVFTLTKKIKESPATFKKIRNLEFSRFTVLGVAGGLLVLVSMFFIVDRFVSETPRIIELVQTHTPAETLSLLLEEGLYTRDKGDARFPKSCSEFAMITMAAAVVIRAIYILKIRLKRTSDKKIKKDLEIDWTLFDLFLSLSLFFFFIPLNDLTAGLAAYTTGRVVLYRYFFAMPWFVLTPVISEIVALWAQKTLKTLRF